MKVRKQWLTTLILLTIIHFFYFCFHTPQPNEAPKWLNQFMFANLLITPLIFNYIIYRCAYRKPGTKLLTFLMVIGPIVYLGSLAAYFFGKIPIPPNTWWYWPYNVLDYALVAWWYLLHWKLRPINKRMQYLKKIESN